MFVVLLCSLLVSPLPRFSAITISIIMSSLVSLIRKTIVRLSPARILLARYLYLQCGADMNTCTLIPAFLPMKMGPHFAGATTRKSAYESLSPPVYPVHQTKCCSCTHLSSFLCCFWISTYTAHHQGSGSPGTEGPRWPPFRLGRFGN